jgi:hypothetical protein
MENKLKSAGLEPIYPDKKAPFCDDEYMDYLKK